MNSKQAALAAVAAFLVAAGCGSMPSIPTIDEIRTVPDSSQSKLLLQDQFEPQSGPIGTLITVHGRGTVFPAGIVNVRFSGTGDLEFDLPEATADLKFRVPPGTASGPFGFVISGRRVNSGQLEHGLPTSNVFEAWRIEAPGFRVTTPTPDGELLPNYTAGQSQHPPPGSGNLPGQGDVRR
jgi:hypothetical protein